MVTRGACAILGDLSGLAIWSVRWRMRHGSAFSASSSSGDHLGQCGHVRLTLRTLRHRTLVTSYLPRSPAISCDLPRSVVDHSAPHPRVRCKKMYVRLIVVARLSERVIRHFMVLREPGNVAKRSGGRIWHFGEVASPIHLNYDLFAAHRAP